MNNFREVYEMHAKLRLGIGSKPKLLSRTEQRHREEFLREQLLETELAFAKGDLGGVASALVDLVVVAMSTAVMMGLPWEPLWNEVMRANMERELDADGWLTKPPHWEPPHVDEVLDSFSQGTPAPAYSKAPDVVALVGPTQYEETFRYWEHHFTMQGCLVLTPGVYLKGDEPLSETAKAQLTQLAKHRVEYADRIFAINLPGTVPTEDWDLIDYAKSLGKPIEYLEKEPK